MEWRDEGLLLAVRGHGESAAIIEVLTAGHGRHAGLVRGGRGRTMAPVLQPGAQLSLEWRARLPEHLGHYRVEPMGGRAAAIMADRLALQALNAMAGLLSLLPEREPNPELYAATVELADRLAGGDPGWPGRYAGWELGLLGALGFPLDLEHCATTGATEGLAFVSPRTGRAVSRAGAAGWEERLLVLPGFLAAGGGAGVGDAVVALELTGHFLDAWVRPALEREALPESRGRLVEGLRRARAAGPLANGPTIG